MLLESSDFDRLGKTEVLCIICSLLFSKEVSHSWFTQLTARSTTNPLSLSSSTATFEDDEGEEDEVFSEH